MRIRWLVLIVALLVSRLGWAGEEPAARQPDPIEEHASTGLEKGKPAPFSGVLISEATAFRQAKAAVDLKALTEKLDVVTKQAKKKEEDLLGVLQQCQESQAKPPPTWWDRNGHIVVFTGGVLVGGTVAVLVVQAVK